jgi:hypothetical protein
MILLYLLLVGVTLGPLGSISFSDNFRISILDIFVSIVLCVLFFKIKPTFKFLSRDNVYKYFLIFLLVAFLSLLIQSLKLTPGSFFISFLYLVRLFLYSLIYPYIKILRTEKKLHYRKSNFPLLKIN